jgi:hypothetical protein
MFCSPSCNKSFSSHSKMFCAFLLFSLAPALWKVLLVRRKFAVLYSRFKLECDHSKSMLLLTRISRAFESHVMWYLNNLMGQEVARGGPASQPPIAAVGVLQSI